MKDIFIAWYTKPRSRNSQNLVYALVLGVCIAILFALLWTLGWMFLVALIYLREDTMDNIRLMLPHGEFTVMFQSTYYLAGGGFVCGFLYSLFMDAFWIPTFEKKTI